VLLSGSSSAATAWSFGFSAGAQRRFRSSAPQSYALFGNPSASHVIAEQWNASVLMLMTGRWFDTTHGTINET
jgi:hypothetical protein